jgi:hypothetical protein
MSALDAFETFFADAAEHSFVRYYEKRGEQKINCGNWETPDPDQSSFQGESVQLFRLIDLEIQVKGNAFVKVAPTVRSFYLLDKTETRVHMRIVNKTRDVPYCDCFQVEEEWIILSPDPSTQAKIQSCAIRQSYGMTWHKSTMMKSIIKSSTETETQANGKAWQDMMVKENNFIFVEKKKPV